MKDRGGIELSVVIPSYNSRLTGLECVNALKAQKTNHEFEILVVDSSDDGTDEILRNCKGIRLIRSEKRLFQGSARNLGVSEARGEIIAFTDSDCVPPPNWVDAICGEMLGSEKKIIGGPILNGTPESRVGTASYLSEFSQYAESKESVVDYVPTANLAIGKELFNRTSRFPDLALPGGEDVIFALSCQKQGILCFFIESIGVAHLNRKGFLQFLRHQYRLGKNAAIIRINEHVPGWWLVYTPPLWLFLPLIRFARIMRRVLALKRFRLKGLEVSPIIFSGTMPFAAGFCAGVTRYIFSRSKGIYYQNLEQTGAM